MSRLRLALNSGAIFTPGGLSTQFTFGITARFRLLPRLGVGGDGVCAAVAGTRRSATTAPRDASSWIAGGGLFLRQPTSEHTAIELGARRDRGALSSRTATSETDRPWLGQSTDADLGSRLRARGRRARAGAQSGAAPGPARRRRLPARGPPQEIRSLHHAASDPRVGPHVRGRARRRRGAMVLGNLTGTGARADDGPDVVGGSTRPDILIRRLPVVPSVVMTLADGLEPGP